MRKDNAYLQDILDAIDDIENFVKSSTFSQFENNKEKLYAVIRCLEIIGEASKKISGETRAEFPKVPWKEISGMRDKLIHSYFGINVMLVWDTVKINIPELKSHIIQILELISK